MIRLHAVDHIKKMASLENMHDVMLQPLWVEVHSGIATETRIAQLKSAILRRFRHLRTSMALLCAPLLVNEVCSRIYLHLLRGVSLGFLSGPKSPKGSRCVLIFLETHTIYSLWERGRSMLCHTVERRNHTPYLMGNSSEPPPRR